MERVFIKPNSREEWLKLRTADLTSTEISAVFGISPYLSRYELWHCKRDKREIPFEPNERTIIGKHLEAGIAAAACELNGWNAAPMDDYGRIPAARLGASFDWQITLDNGQRALLEIKNVDYLIYKNQWINPATGEEEAPPHIELQVQHQMLVSGIDWAAIFALVGGNQPVTLIREADPIIHAAIRSRAAEFWRTVDAGEKPQPDYSRDYDAIARLNTDLQAETHRETDPKLDALVAAYSAAHNDEKQAKTRKAAACGEIITHMGDAQYAIADGYKINCGLTKTGKRTCRITLKGDASDE